MVIVQSHHHVRVGRIDDYLDAVRDLASETIKENGCVFFRVIREIHEPERFTIIEGYADDVARRDHLDSSHHQNFKGRIVGAMASYPHIVKSEPIFPSDPRRWP